MLKKPALWVVCKPAIWEQVAPILTPLVPSLFQSVTVGNGRADFANVRGAAAAAHDATPAPVVVFGGTDATHDLLKGMCEAKDINRVRWIHSYFVGVDALRLKELSLPPGLPISNARNDSSSQYLAEHVLLSVLYFNRSVAQRQADRRDARWNTVQPVIASGQTLGIVGYGDIGRSIARAASAGLGMRVRGYRQSAPTAPIDDLGTEVFTGPDGLRAVLRDSDFVVAVLPRTEATNHFFARDTFAMMKPGAVFINVGRGSTVKEADLVEAVRSGHLKGTALDVFEQEPLPSDNPLWSLGDHQFLMTAHDASPNVYGGSARLSTVQFVEYAKQFVNYNKLPSYLIDPSRGY